MTRGRHAKPSKVNQKLGVAAIAGVTGLGTMLSMVPASFADTLPSNNESQNTASEAVSSAVKLTGLQGAQSALDATSSALGSLALDASGYQTQPKQQAVAENLSSLTKNLEGILHDTPYMAKLQSVQSGLDGVENTLKTPNLPNSDLEGPTKTQGQLQNLVKQLQSIIDDASAQYGTELKNAVDDYNKTNLPATETGVDNAVKAATSVYNTARAANNPDLASANSTFSTNAGSAVTAAGSASDASTLLGKAAAAKQDAQTQLQDVQNKLNGLYNSSSSPATGTLVTDAQNFDNWAHSWIASANTKSGGYNDFKDTLTSALNDIETGEANHTLTITNQADASTVVTNLKAWIATVDTIQTTMANCDTASMHPDEAFSTAMRDGMSLESTFRTLQKFLNESAGMPGGGAGTIPEAVGGEYGGTSLEAWPTESPFSGTGATALNNVLFGNNSTLSSYMGNLPSMRTYNDVESAKYNQWLQDYANYKYLQSVEPYAQDIYNDASSAFSDASAAAAKIAAAKELAEQHTGDAASDSAAAAQAKQDVQDALQDVAQVSQLGGKMTTAMNNALDLHNSATNSSGTPSVIINGITVDLPTVTNKSPLYSQSDISGVQSALTSAVGQANTLLSGSDSGTGTSGLLGDAGAWQKAIVTQGVYDNAQRAYDGIQKVQQDLANIKSAANPGAAIDSLNQLQSDLTPLINATQSAVNGMKSGNQTIQGLGQQAPYTQSDISNADTPLSSALPLSSASNADNPIQKAIGNGNVYNFAHPIVVGLDSLQPTIHTLIGDGAEPGLAQKILALPFQVISAPSAPSAAVPSGGASPTRPTTVGGPAQVQSAKPASDLATTGSDAAAAAIGAAVLLAAGVAAELLKKKGLKKEK